MTDRLDANGALGALPISVARLPGSRWVSALAVDRDGLVSLPMGRDLGPDPNTKARVHFLAAGIDNYKTVPQLNFARADAETLANSLREAAGKSIALGSATALTDEQATAEAILTNARRLVEQAAFGETIVFSFAGHGDRDSAGNFYLAAVNTDLDNIAATSLSWDRLAVIFSKAKARVVVFLDACHSGAAGTGSYATNDDAASGLLAKVPSSLAIFSASEGRELPEEQPQSGGGVFTNAVADVISRKCEAHDSNGNGAIEISELYYGVKRQTVLQTKGRQTPWLARNQMVGDFALF